MVEIYFFFSKNYVINLFWNIFCFVFYLKSVLIMLFIIIGIMINVFFKWELNFFEYFGIGNDCSCFFISLLISLYFYVFFFYLGNVFNRIIIDDV